MHITPTPIFNNIMPQHSFILYKIYILIFYLWYYNYFNRCIPYASMIYRFIDIFIYRIGLLITGHNYMRCYQQSQIYSDKVYFQKFHNSFGVLMQQCFSFDLLKLPKKFVPENHMVIYLCIERTYANQIYNNLSDSIGVKNKQHRKYHYNG